MADKNPHESNLAVAVHDAEYEVAAANMAPAGPNRIERITKAQDALTQAETAYDDCASGRGYATPLKR
jgi:hypothetical protein